MLAMQPAVAIVAMSMRMLLLMRVKTEAVHMSKHAAVVTMRAIIVLMAVTLLITHGSEDHA
eukprot:1411264-Alexandrium_andersonii.AAC.1